MKYILNSAVVTTFGLYKYEPITTEQAIEFLADGDFVSTIGYAETAAALSVLIGREIPVNRIIIAMKPGDQALVFRLTFPPGSSRLNVGDKGNLTPEFVLENCELGLLTRLE